MNMSLTDFIEIDPPEPRKTTTGIRAGMRVNKAGQKSVWLFLSKDAQKEIFGRSIANERFKVMLGQGQAAGQLQMVTRGAGKWIALPRIKGSVAIEIGSWAGLPSAAQKISDCRLVRGSPDRTGAVFQLPDWARHGHR